MYGWTTRIVAVHELKGGDILADFQGWTYFINDVTGDDMQIDISTDVGRTITLRPDQRVRIKRYA